MTDVLSVISSCATLEEEFWYHVSAQEELPLAAARARPEIAQTLEHFLQLYREEDLAIGDLLRRELVTNPDLLHQLRGLVSVSDKRLYLDLSFLFSHTIFEQNKTLCGCAPSALIRHQTSFFVRLLRHPGKRQAAADVITTYLLGKGLGEILSVYAGLLAPQREAIVSALIAPKESQHQEAKLRGHGPEAELAKLLKAVDLKIVPRDKAENPMSEHDPNIDLENLTIVGRDRERTFSSDIVIMNDQDSPAVCIVSLVHSSDPGQFGVDKANTVRSIKVQIDRFNGRSNRKVELWGLVDGVGYSENKNGTINAMLPHFDCFLQLKSLWKAALKAHEIGLAQVAAIRFDEEFYSEEMLRDLAKYVPQDVQVLESHSPAPFSCEEIPAGKATLYYAVET